jgi:gamma-glutamyltranspeptidase / glutathione hydrolase
MVFTKTGVASTSKRWQLHWQLSAVALSIAAAGCSSGDAPPTQSGGGQTPPTLTPTPGVSENATGYAKSVVAVSNPLAAKAGLDIMAAGGNAIDAAAAIQFALNVVEPQSSGIGGGGFMMVYVAKENKVYVVDSREKAPAAATPTMFSALSFEDASTTGISIGVPGTLRGVSTALKNWGSISLAKSLEPAIALAENGHKVSDLLAADINNTSDRGFVMTNLHPETAAIFRPAGVPLAKDALFKQPDLAKTLKLIRDQGPDVFYKGEIATAIVSAQQRGTTTGAAGSALTTGAAGLMAVADLANYNAAVRTPLTGNYRGYGVVTMPPPSGGGITVLQQLKMLEQFPIGDKSKGFGFGEKNTLNVMIDGMRLAFQDRNYWEGDADFVKVPVAGLLDSVYLETRRTLIKVGTALKVVDLKPGNPLPRDNANAKQQPIAQADPREGNHTTHFVVADNLGNVVSYTTTVESLFGSGITVPGYGFLLNNQLTDFNWPPTFNLATGDIGANDVAPYKRPRSSMSPTLLMKDGKPFAAYGAAGGSKIINAVVQITANLLDHGMSVEQAIDAPRISARAGGSVFCETGPFTPTGFTPTPAFSPTVISAVNAMREPAIGMPPCDGNEANGANLSAQALVIDWNTGKKYGAADKRRNGTVGGLN